MNTGAYPYIFINLIRLGIKLFSIILILQIQTVFVFADEPELIPVEDYSDFIPFGFDPLQANNTNNKTTGFTKLLFVDAVAARGNDIFVVDTSQRKIFHIDRMQRTLNEFATLATGSDADIYVSSDLNIYVTDRLQRHVIQYARDGRIIRTFGNESSLLNPGAVYESEEMNRLLIADSISGYIAVFNRLGGLSGTIGQNINIPNPAGSIIDMVVNSNFIYLLDQLTHEVSVIDTSGNQLYKLARSELKHPVAMAIDYCQRLYVADQFDNTIYIYYDEDPISVFKNNNSGLNGFEMITDIWIDNDLLYVSDGASGKIKVIKIVGGCL